MDLGIQDATIESAESDEDLHAGIASFQEELNRGHNRLLAIGKIGVEQTVLIRVFRSEQLIESPKFQGSV